MPGKKITELPIALAAQLTDILPEVQGGITKQVNLQQIYNLFGFSSSVLTPTYGGTGVSNPTAHTIPIAEGSSNFNFVGPLTDGQLLIGSTGVDPVAASITAGTGISVTPGAGSITINATGGSVSAGLINQLGWYAASGSTISGLPTVASGVLTTVSSTPTWATQLSLALGGTNASLTASNGGIFYSTATAGAILSGTAIAGQMLRSGSSDAPTWSTSTWPATTTINQILYSSSANTVAGLATLNSSSLATSSTGVPTWLGPLTNGQIVIGSTGSTPVAANLTAGPGVSISNGAGSVTISGTGSGIGWTEVTGTTQAMAADSGYVTNNAGLVTLTLPVTAAFGTAISIIGKGVGGWSIAQNASQIIQVGSVASTTGVGGSVASTNRYDSVDLICTTANTIWTVLGGPMSAGLTIV